MTTCPSPDTLEVLLHGRLSGRESEVVRAHVGTCSACQAILDRLSDHPQFRRWAGKGQFATPMTAPVGLMQQLRETPALPPADTRVESSTNDEAQTDRAGLAERVGPYKVLGELGRGGMGIVLKVYDADLQRVVAVKVLQEGKADERARERFVREARAAAGIKHDNVVAVYGVASPASGPPYMVMEYVAGPSLLERIKSEQGLNPREAATIVCQAADGLAAAHHAGLIHRDIKPANILLEPLRGDAANYRAKITDFGLVRVKEVPGRTTQEGVVRGTPEYMSPEQIRQPAAIDERSDIYGLGATLYEALTSELPFRGAPLMVVRQVLHDEPTAPRRLSDRVPRDLEIITLKAMSKEPGRRYPSAGEMRDDLRRWLNGEPIRARPVGRVERAWRWAQRRPLVAGLTAAVVVASLAGIFGILSQWLRAENERERAEDRRIKAHETVHEYFTKVSEDKLLGKPGMHAIRKDLLDLALRYYQGFLVERADDPKMQAEVADTHLRVARINDQIGSKKTARAACHAALAIYQELLRINPNDVHLHAKQAKAYVQLGKLAADFGALDEALSFFAQAKTIQEPLVISPADTAEYQSALAETQMQIGSIHTRKGTRPAALQALERARDLRRELVEVHRDRVEFQTELARSYQTLGKLHSDGEDYQPALDAVKAAQAIEQRLVDNQPTNDDFRDNLATSHSSIAVVQTNLGRFDDAFRSYEQCRNLREQLVYANPHVSDYQWTLAQLYTALGKHCNQRSRLKEGLVHLQQAQPLVEKLIRLNRELPDYRRQLADIHIARGHAQSKLDPPGDAISSFQEALNVLEQLVKDFPDQPDYRYALGVSSHNFGNELQQLAKLPEAKAAFERARDLFVELSTADRKVPYYRYLLGLCHLKLGGLHARQKQWLEAKVPFQKGMEVCIQLCIDQPKSPDYSRLLSMCHTRLGEVAAGLRQPVEAEASYREALAIQERIAREHEGFTDIQLDIARTYGQLGELRVEAKQFSEAMNFYEQMRGRAEKALQLNRDSLPTKGVLGQAWNGVGVCLAGLGRRDDALKAHQEAAPLHLAVFNKMPQQTANRERLSDHYKHVARLQREREHPADAVAATLERWKLWPADPKELYAVAVELAMCAESRPPADQVESAKVARLAIDALQQAIDSGFQDVQDIQVNPAFHSLRSHPNFPPRR